MVHPVTEARFLGIWLDRKLNWSGQVKALKRKMAVQMFSLTKLTATTWGCRVQRARQLYTAVIRSTLAFGSGIWHPAAEEPAGPVKKLEKFQSSSLRIILGAYRATPIRALETSLRIPPLDLYLSQQKLAFETRLEKSGMADQIKQACAAVKTHL